MKKLWHVVGRISFYLTYPALALYLSKDQRTRIVVIHAGRVILVKTWLGNGKWDLPGGGLHRSEDPCAGVIRELAEEIGIRPDPASVRFIKKELFKKGLFRYKVHYFSTSLETEPTITMQKAEIIETQWFTENEIRELKIHRQIKEVVGQALSTTGSML